MPPHTLEDDLALSVFRGSAVPKSGFSRFNAFAPTERWFRTVNDAYMTQNTHPSISQLEAAGSGFLSDLIQQRMMEIYGIFHPTHLARRRWPTATSSGSGKSSERRNRNRYQHYDAKSRPLESLSPVVSGPSTACTA